MAWRFSLLVALAIAAAGPAAAAPGQVATLDLSAPFATRSPWRFTATQGPDVTGINGEPAPGAIRLCLSRNGGQTCQPGLDRLLALATDDQFAEPHYVTAARIVRPTAHRPLLLIRVASQHSGDGDQRIATAALAYDRATDSFTEVYRKRTGHNNNQEVRYIAAGPLRGAIVAAEPTADAPFGFWITVDRLGDGGYRPVLRFRSATRYNDGNPLAVIDSEMPAIAQRLGVWHKGAPLPLPAGRCARPHLVGRELWCA